MDINCTYNCIHQFHGKCNLMDVKQSYNSSLTSMKSVENHSINNVGSIKKDDFQHSAISDLTTLNNITDIDCPYYAL